MEPAEQEIVHTHEKYDFPDSLYQDRLERVDAYGIVSGDGKLRSCIEVRPEEWSNRLIVTELWVSDELQHQGIGKRLMDKAKEIAVQQQRRALILETQTCNTNAIGRREVRLNLGYFFHMEAVRRYRAMESGGQ